MTSAEQTPAQQALALKMQGMSFDEIAMLMKIKTDHAQTLVLSAALHALKERDG